MHSYGNILYCGNDGVEMYDAYAPNEVVPEIVVIPSHVKGIAVTAISQYAFCKCLAIRQIKIYAQIESINKMAFFGCTNLTSINIPASCKLIDYCAIDGRYDNEEGQDFYNEGLCTITFDLGSNLQMINVSGISNIHRLSIFLYDKIFPQNSTYTLGGVRELKIYSPYSFKFCGFRTIPIERKTFIQRSRFIYFIPLFALNIFCSSS